jgi:hypothetical protein
VVAEADDVEGDLGQAFQVGGGVDCGGEVGGQVAVAFDQGLVAVAAVGGEGGPDGEGAGPAGGLGARRL